jgi:hypothetical protein
MKTLFEQLSKEDQDKMKNYEHKMIAKKCLDFLKDNWFSIDTPVMIASNTLDIVRGNCYDTFKLYEFYNLFENK